MTTLYSPLGIGVAWRTRREGRQSGVIVRGWR